MASPKVPPSPSTSWPNRAAQIELYRFFCERLEAQFIQFIPIVERESQNNAKATKRSVNARKYGRFLNAIFNEWIHQDVGHIFVRIFDAALGAWLKQPPGICIFAPACGSALALEHNGDLYACYHYVQPEYLLGNIQQEHMIDLASSQKQRRLGAQKYDTLPTQRLNGDWLFACHGGCPRNRFNQTPKGEPSLNYLCADYKLFFKHAQCDINRVANLLRHGQLAAAIKRILTLEKNKN